MDLIRRILRPFGIGIGTPATVPSISEDAVTEPEEAQPKSISQRRNEIEMFVRNIVARIEGAEALGISTPEAIAAHFNESGLTTRKGRNWTGETVAKFLSSPGAKRFRTNKRAI
jgi:hypothetical protein